MLHHTADAKEWPDTHEFFFLNQCFDSGTAVESLNTLNHNGRQSSLTENSNSHRKQHTVPNRLRHPFSEVKVKYHWEKRKTYCTLCLH